MRSPSPASVELRQSLRRGSAVLVAGLLLVACQPAGSTSPEPSPAATPKTVTVEITDSSFGDDLTIPVGSTVVFLNHDPIDHTATHGTDGQMADGSLFDLRLPNGGGTDSFTFHEPGEYPVTCFIHPSMNLTITVE